MTYKIEWCEVIKTGSGAKGPWKLTKMSLTDSEGNKMEDVQTFMEVIPGQEIEGSVIKNQTYGSLEFKPLARPNFMKNRSSDIKQAMEKKEASIHKFQDTKDLSIKTSSSMNKSIDLAIADGEMTQEQRKETILYWRKWVWNHWEDPQEYPPFE